MNLQLSRTFNIRDFRQRRPGPGTLRRHGEHGEQPQGYPGGDGVHVQPEGDPGQDDDQDRRDVDLRDVEAETPGQFEPQHDARVIHWNGGGVQLIRSINSPHDARVIHWNDDEAQCTVPQNLNILPFLYLLFGRLIRFIANRKYAFFCVY